MDNNEQALNDLQDVKDLSYQEILNNMLDSNNLELKTHINQPKQLAGLNILAQYLDSIGLDDSADMLFSFIDIFLTYMVSYKRLSRTEIIKALTSNLAQERENQEKIDEGIR